MWVQTHTYMKFIRFTNTETGADTIVNINNVLSLSEYYEDKNKTFIRATNEDWFIVNAGMQQIVEKIESLIDARTSSVINKID